MADLEPIKYAEPERRDTQRVKNMVATLLLEAALQARIEADGVVERMHAAKPYMPVYREVPPVSEEVTDSDEEEAQPPPKRPRTGSAGGGGRPARAARARRVVEESSDGSSSEDEGPGAGDVEARREEIVQFLEQHYEAAQYNEALMLAMQGVVGEGQCDVLDLPLAKLEELKNLITRYLGL
eukprot:TRINITY_DN7466_c0_g1_i1.p2 TRINITY_DN7466_c0_g1~~TRINITY_DN7466_c0_g1_i1.p2  ORF type:complete len:196 (+),score=84.35 TRINITY_DN7466_c0_g1_i1:43-588(+)